MRVLRVSSLGGLDPETAEIAEEQLLGTDFMFFVAFAGTVKRYLYVTICIKCLTSMFKQVAHAKSSKKFLDTSVLSSLSAPTSAMINMQIILEVY